MEITGIWYNGQSSRGEQVTLRLSAAGHLQVENAGEMVELEINKLSISTRLGKTPRNIQIPSQGHIQCDDSELLDSWFPKTSVIEKWVDWIERRRSAALTAAAITVAGVVLFYFYGIPYAALKVAPMISPKIEAMMSEQVMNVLEMSSVDESSLPKERQAELQAKFKALIKGLDRESEMKLLLRDAPGIGPNAFALPDGTIVVTDDLVKLAKNDEQIVSVMAHEAGHHEHRHGIRQTLESAGILVIAAAVFGDVSGSSLTVSMPMVLLQNGYSRGHELEADDFAFELLIKRGQSPQAFADMFKLMQKELGDVDDGDDKVANYLSTHPASLERIRRAEEAAKKMKK
jgi:predicted Zn-dependent protease